MKHTLEPSKVRRIGAVAALLVAGFAGSLTAAAPAQAVPSGCIDGPDGARGSYALCTTGTGAFRSWTQCRRWYWPNNWYMKYGPWRAPGPDKSVSSCDYGDTRYSYGRELS